MPSKSKAQHNLMAAVAHNPGFAKKVGIPQSVGKDFSDADKSRKFGKGGFTSSRAKINKQNTRHGKYDLPFTALNKYAGMAEGGDVKESRKTKKYATGGKTPPPRPTAQTKPALYRREPPILSKVPAASAPASLRPAPASLTLMGSNFENYSKPQPPQASSASAQIMSKAKGGSVSSASKRADGIASKGKTRGKFV